MNCVFSMKMSMMIREISLRTAVISKTLPSEFTGGESLYEIDLSEAEYKELSARLRERDAAKRISENAHYAEEYIRPSKLDAAMQSAREAKL
jgi:hypothetical protein